MIDKRKEFLEVLFDSEDYVAFGKNDAAASKARYPIPEWYTTNEGKFCINPLGKDQKRNTSNIGDNIYSFLFEMDKDENNKIIDKKKQVRMFLDSGIPYTTMTYSGDKSIHLVIRFTKPITNKWFKSWWEAMNRVLVNKGLPIDPATCKIPQLSRVPNSIRDVNIKDDEGNVIGTKKVKQTLININRRIEQSEMLEWLDANGEEVLQPYVPPVREYTPDMNAEVSDEEKFKAAYNMFKSKHGEYQPSLESGNWMNLINFSSYLYKVDLSLNASMSLANTLCGSKTKGSGGDFYTETAIEKGWKDAESKGYEKIQVETTEQYKERMRLERHDSTLQEQQLNINAWLEDSDEDVALNEGGINEYVRVGTKYFNRSEGQLEMWNESTLKADFGNQAVREFPSDNKYLKFVNKVDYFKSTGRIGKNYNLFVKPDWTPTPGEWPHTATLLRRVFGECGENQIEDGYDYIQLAITNPKQLLHALVLTSTARETGKDSFMEWLQFLLGLDNVYIGMIDEFLDGFNGSFCSKHFICLNEVKISGMNKQAIQKLKTWTTQKTVNRNEKNQPIQTIQYWGRLILATNFAEDFMNIDDEENRFWIRTLPFLDKNGPDFDPLFMEKLEAEVPHFLHFILNRKLNTSVKEGRFWLPSTVTNTSGLRLVQKNNKSNMYYEIEAIIDQVINNVREDAIYFTSSGIREKLPADKDNNLKYIRKVLEGEFKLISKKRLRTDVFSNFDKEPKNSNYYEVIKDDWNARNSTEIEVELPY